MDTLDTLNTILQLNLPVGYFLMGAIALWGAYAVVRKTLVTATNLASKIPFALITAGLLAATGLGGAGFSIGDLIVRKGPETKEVSNSLLTNKELIALATASGDQGRLESVLNYAKNRDKLVLDKGIAKNYTVVYDGGKETAVAAPVEVVPESVDKPVFPLQGTIGLLGLSIAAIIASIVQTVRYGNSSYSRGY